MHGRILLFRPTSGRGLGVCLGLFLGLQLASRVTWTAPGASGAVTRGARVVLQKAKK